MGRKDNNAVAKEDSVQTSLPDNTANSAEAANNSAQASDGKGVGQGKLDLGNSDGFVLYVHLEFS